MAIKVFNLLDDTADNSVDTIDLTDSMAAPITLSSLDSLSITSTTYSPITGAVGIGTTMGTNGSFTWANHQPTASIASSGKLALKGEEADIEINGVSLSETLKAIQQQLNILRPNIELEQEWDKLRELGEQYRQLEIEFKEKSKMWNTLKSMPPPDIE